MIESITLIVSGIVSAVAYSLVFYAKKREKGQEFEPRKFVSTLLVGSGVGVFLVISGIEVNQTNFLEVLTANVGMIALVESMLKWASRKVGK